MADTAPDPVAAEIAAIRERAANELEKWRLTPEPSAGIHMSAHDVPVLARALEAVLANHQPGRLMILGKLCSRHEACRHFSITSTEAAGVRECPDCTAAVHVSCAGCGGLACQDRLAISSALLGKEGTGNGR